MKYKKMKENRTLEKFQKKVRWMKKYFFSEQYIKKNVLPLFSILQSLFEYF